MGTNVFKIKTADEGQDFLVHDVGGVFVEKFCQIRSAKISSQSQTIPDGQSYSFQFFNLDVKDMAGFFIVVHSPQDLSDYKASVMISANFLTADNAICASINEMGIAGFSWREPINPNRPAHSYTDYYQDNLPPICNIADFVVEVENNSGSDADVTVDIYGNFQNIGSGF